MAIRLSASTRFGTIIFALILVAILVIFQLSQNRYLLHQGLLKDPRTECIFEGKINISMSDFFVDRRSTSTSHSIPADFVTHEQDPRPTRALFAISMGKSAAESKMVERFVWSARNKGEYTGPIVLLTDAPASRYDSLGNWTGNLIVMNPFFEDFVTNFTHKDMSYKRFKTLVLQYLSIDTTLDGVELVYYLDIDIVFGAPLAGLFQHLENQYNISEVTANNSSIGRMWMFRNKLPHYQIQGGQMILHRTKSLPCLDRWRWYMDSNPRISKDQELLNRMYEEQNNGDSNCEIVSMLHKDAISFPDKKLIESIGKSNVVNGTLSGTEYRPLVHIKNTGQSSESNPAYYKAFVQDVMGFEGESDDPIGMTERMVMS